MINIEQFVKDAIQKNKPAIEIENNFIITATDARLKVKRAELKTVESKEMRDIERVTNFIRNLFIFINTSANLKLLKIQYTFRGVYDFEMDTEKAVIIANFFSTLGYDVAVLEKQYHSTPEDYKDMHRKNFTFLIYWNEYLSSFIEGVAKERKSSDNSHLIYYNWQRR